MFETNNLRLRAVREADFAKLHDLWNDYRIQKTLESEYVVPLGVKFEEKLRSWVKDGFFYAIIETKENSEWAGFINLFNAENKNRAATVSIALLPAFWGQGYATEALRFIVDYSFRELALHRVNLQVLGHNAAAIKLYKKVGFVEEGVQRKAGWSDGKWQDVIWMAMLDEDWAASRKENV
ncbi:acyl-CoA N-acyltransferase [Gymnopus androsaceus JB14]|uniref:Acyl-CoA N-acyltransferase n=1 Tax=Gymnopus androsaceus JB14 TaxID=1447944 RepID=A0A6A4I5M0_9AGAR|nr:acyl-CoA N-acyltransferase [Gymnopus androsaceus JB14]